MHTLYAHYLGLLDSTANVLCTAGAIGGALYDPDCSGKQALDKMKNLGHHLLINENLKFYKIFYDDQEWCNCSECAPKLKAVLKISSTTKERYKQHVMKRFETGRAGLSQTSQTRRRANQNRKRLLKRCVCMN
jgi:hypothetical protein